MSEPACLLPALGNLLDPIYFEFLLLKCCPETGKVSWVGGVEIIKLGMSSFISLTLGNVAQAVFTCIMNALFFLICPVHCGEDFIIDKVFTVGGGRGGSTQARKLEACIARTPVLSPSTCTTASSTTCFPKPVQYGATYVGS